VSDWRAEAKGLADELSRTGDLVTPRWREVVCAVPRHTLVPAFYTQNEDATWRRHDGADGDAETWLSTIYADETLITALAELPPDSPGTGYLAVSSSTMPSLMVRMLEALDVHDDSRVLEIGTGSGYNAALLTERLGSEHVVTVDLDPTLVGLAQDRLRVAGYTPTVLARDGADGAAEHAPYDRIIATCAVPAIPPAWIAQVVEGGTILADLKVRGMGGNLVQLRRQGATAVGRFLPAWAGFMNMRHAVVQPTRHHPRRDHDAAPPARSTPVPTQPWDHTVPWFLAMLAELPPNLTYGWLADGGTWLSTTDGSWAEVRPDDAGGHQVTEGGPVTLWGHVEQAWQTWQAAGEPAWSRFGLTVTPDNQIVWLDDPTGQTWQVPSSRPR